MKFVNHNCRGCKIEGKTSSNALNLVKGIEQIRDPCPDEYEDSLKGLVCAVAHFHTEKVEYYLCDNHYEIYLNRKNTHYKIKSKNKKITS